MCAHYIHSGPRGRRSTSQLYGTTLKYVLVVYIHYTHRQTMEQTPPHFLCLIYDDRDKGI